MAPSKKGKGGNKLDATLLDDGVSTSDRANLRVDGAGEGYPNLDDEAFNASVNDGTDVISVNGNGDDDADFAALGVQQQEKKETDNTKSLVISFLAMLVVGLGNKIFQVLQLQPMYNYPLYDNLATTFVYVPLSFLYIVPMIYFGSAITPEARRVPKRKFAVMGCLDSLAGIMQTLGVDYIANGSLVVLLQQAAIPISLLMSKWLLKVEYKMYQYVGAVFVGIGIITVLLPALIDPTHEDGAPSAGKVALWSGVFILSCVPMCLSSIYKEMALGDTELDAVYLNGWIAIFQLAASFPLLIPAALGINVSLKDLPENIYDGAKCYLGHNTIHHNTTEAIAHNKAHEHGHNPHKALEKRVKDLHNDDCDKSFLYMNIYLAFNLGYNILIILILKYGSANILWMALTIMVPLSNVSFTLDFMPDHKALRSTDIIGLVVIMGGLVMYRFYGPLRKMYLARRSPGRFLTVEGTDYTVDTVSTPGGTQSEVMVADNSVGPTGMSTPNMGAVGAHGGVKGKGGQGHNAEGRNRWQENRTQRDN